MRPQADKMGVWIDFTGRYEKHECDIMLKDGSIIECCWPNGGIFNKLWPKLNDNHQVITGDKILKIRYKDYFKKLKH